MELTPRVRHDISLYHRTAPVSWVPAGTLRNIRLVDHGKVQRPDLRLEPSVMARFDQVPDELSPLHLESISEQKRKPISFSSRVSSTLGSAQYCCNRRSRRGTSRGIWS
jgi:hypothetical protein